MRISYRFYQFVTTRYTTASCTILSQSCKLHDCDNIKHIQDLYNLPDIFTNQNISPSTMNKEFLTQTVRDNTNIIDRDDNLLLFSWQFRFFVFHFHVVILLYNLAVFKSLLPVSRLVRRWYRFISKCNKLITSFPCICCLSSIVTMQLLGIAFILYLLKLSAGNGFCLCIRFDNKIMPRF